MVCTEGLGPHPSPRAAASSLAAIPPGRSLFGGTMLRVRVALYQPWPCGLGRKRVSIRAERCFRRQTVPSAGPAPSRLCVCVCAVASCIPAGVPCSSEMPAALPAPLVIKYRLKLAVKAAPPGSSTACGMLQVGQPAAAPQPGARGARGTRPLLHGGAGFQRAASLPGPRHGSTPLAPAAALRGLPGGSATSEAILEAFPAGFTPLGCARAGAAGEARGSFWDRKSAHPCRVSPRALGELLFLAALPISRH